MTPIRQCTLTTLVFLISITCSAEMSAPQSPLACQSVALVAGHDAYNQAICQGINQLEHHQYAKAIEHFQHALSLPLLNIPNMYIYPDLALAYFSLGKLKPAHAMLERAEISLKIYTRLLRCQDTPKGYLIVKDSWGQWYKINSRYHDELAPLLCQDAFFSVYYPEQLSSQIKEAKLVAHFINIKQQIDPVTAPMLGE